MVILVVSGIVELNSTAEVVSVVTFDVESIVMTCVGMVVEGVVVDEVSGMVVVGVVVCVV